MYFAVLPGLLGVGGSGKSFKTHLAVITLACQAARQEVG